MNIPTKGLALAVLMLAAFHAKAEDAAYSASAIPSAPIAIQAKIEVKHHNFSRLDYALYGGVVAYRLGDYFTTEDSLSRGAREVQLPQCFVASKPGFMAYSLGMAGLQIAGSVFLHRHGHAKLARLADAVSISAGTITDWHNTTQHVR